MIVFPNAKINLGLAITERRNDGYHTIETVFCPIGWNDVVEVVEQSEKKVGTVLKVTGTLAHAVTQQNIVLKASALIRKKYKLPHFQIHLHKVIPSGAGLGGGSADAVFFLKLINEKFELGISQHELLEMALKLGSDCPFFVYNKPMFAKGRGEELEEIKLELKGYKILVVNPGIHCPTKRAFEGIVPAQPKMSIKKCVTTLPIEEWRKHLFNDFETKIFQNYPTISELKNKMYADGAVYASMSGSGSSVYGIFETIPDYKLKQGESLFSGNFLE